MNKRLRSQNYPSASISDALEKVRKIHQGFITSPVDRETAAKHLGFAGLTGPANQLLGSLRQYGLIEPAGKGLFRVSQMAIDIILPPPGSPERGAEATREAAWTPSLFQELRSEFPEVAVPPQAAVENSLRRSGYTEKAVRKIVPAFLATAEYVKTKSESQTAGHSQADGAQSVKEAEELPPTHREALIGDLIQWECQGSLQFPEPVRVRAISDDGEWVFVEDSDTGIPMHEVTVAERKSSGEPPKLPVSVGAQEQLEYKLTASTRVRIISTGQLGAAEIASLIKMLEAQRAVLDPT